MLSSESMCFTWFKRGESLSSCVLILKTISSSCCSRLSSSPSAGLLGVGEYCTSAARRGLLELGTLVPNFDSEQGVEG